MKRLPRNSHGIKAEPQPIFTHHHSRPLVGEFADEVLGKVQLPGPGEVAEVTPETGIGQCETCQAEGTVTQLSPAAIS